MVELMNKQITVRLLFASFACVYVIAVSLPARAQENNTDNAIEEAIRQLSSDNVRGYVQPFINGFGANLNSGWYNTADIGDMGFHFRLQVIGMGTLISDADKVYNAVPPQPFAQVPVETATLFGGRGTTVTGPGGTTYQFQNGQVKTSIMPTATFQLTVGNVFGTQAVIRYFPPFEENDFPRTTFFGVGARHSVSRYLPSSPVDLAGGFFYQKLTIGDIMEAKALAVGAQASKSFSVLTLYGGLQYETSTLTLSYTNTSTNTTVNTDIDGENHVRATAGLTLNLVILNLNADVSVGKVTVLSGGLSFGM
jgi:hypothetical protein